MKDLIAARREAGQPLHFEVEDVARRPRDRPTIRYRHDGEEHELDCEAIAGCDGFHGVCRDADPRRRADRAHARVPVRLARHPGRGRALDRRADLRHPRARLRPPQPPLARAQPALHPGRPARRHRELARRADLGGAAHPLREARLDPGRGPGDREGDHADALASWSSRCSTSGSTWPATPPTSSRPPAPRASTSRSPTCSVLAQALTDWLQNDDDSGLDAYSETCLRASGACSTSPGG